MPYEECYEDRYDHDRKQRNPRGAAAVSLDDDWISLSHGIRVSQAKGAAKLIMWNTVGIALALTIAAVAIVRSRAKGGYYDTEVYGMVPATHQRYAAISLAFAGFFGVALALGAQTAGTVALAAYALIALLYGTSFLRGFSDDSE